MEPPAVPLCDVLQLHSMQAAACEVLLVECGLSVDAGQHSLCIRLEYVCAWLRVAVDRAHGTHVTPW
jgi:hypothetical protein